jgi:hypothetical protein
LEQINFNLKSQSRFRSDEFNQQDKTGQPSDNCKIKYFNNLKQWIARLNIAVQIINFNYLRIEQLAAQVRCHLPQASACVRLSVVFGRANPLQERRRFCRVVAAGATVFGGGLAAS